MSQTQKCMILLQNSSNPSNLYSCVHWLARHRKRYVCCMYCCSSSHANGLVRNQLKVHVLQKDRESNNSFQQSELITNTLTRPATEWNESVEYIYIYIRSISKSKEWMCLSYSSNKEHIFLKMGLRNRKSKFYSLKGYKDNNTWNLYLFH